MTLLFSLLAQTNMVEPVQAAALDAQAAVPPLNLGRYRSKAVSS